jgi:predicted NAD/FAD-binding protein
MNNRKSIAVVGSGIAGMTAAHLLSRQYQVTLFEAEDRLGGHTATRDVEIAGQKLAVDTGFIVFNDWTYPNFIRLLDQLGVASQPTEMSFSVSCEISGLEYNGHNLDTLFAQRKNIVSPKFLRMLGDVLKFNKEAPAELEAGLLKEDETLGSYLKRKRYSPAFVQDYLIPMGAAIWSSGMTAMQDFPVIFFVRFFKNHGLLNVSNRPQWRVIKGGSRAYIEPLVRPFAEGIRLSTPVTGIHRRNDKVQVTSRFGEEEFDELVLACHSDQALELLKDASDREQELLQAVPYRMNDVVLHTDARLLPRQSRAWASWNYRRRDPARLQSGQDDLSLVSLTYYMNRLQGLKLDEHLCVTLNDPDKVLGRYRYAHPVFTLKGMQAQQDIQKMNGQQHTWFCGAWCRNGFHEDGVASALAVTEKLGVTL